MGTTPKTAPQPDSGPSGVFSALAGGGDEPRAFDLLMSELQRLNLSDWQSAELLRVVAGFSGQRVTFPAARSLRRAEALAFAHRALALGDHVPVVVERLIWRGLSRTAAYRVIRLARRDLDDR